MPTWQAYINKRARADVAIGSYQSLIAALDARHAVFHGLVAVRPITAWRHPCHFQHAAGAGSHFKLLLGGTALTVAEADAYKTAVLLDVGRMNAKRGWAMQLHLAAVRNLNTQMFNTLGPDTVMTR